MSSDYATFETRPVRPYAVTGGRVRAARNDLALEALVETLPGADRRQGLTPEKREIVRLAGLDFISLAELSALVRLPVGVTRILVCDMVDVGILRLCTPPADETSSGEPSLSLSLLESVLNGISAL